MAPRSPLSPVSLPGLPARSPPDRYRLSPVQRRLYLAGFLTGLVVSLVLVSQSQVVGDTLNLLARGWLLAFEGTWIPFGNPTSAGGVAPGGLTALLTGLPLLVWQHHRAPVLVVWLFHLLAFLVLDRWLRTVLRPEERLLFVLLYWIAPWRIYFSGFLWNPNYLFLFGALHGWSAYRQRERSRFVDSLAHVLAVGLALHLHASFLILAVSSLLLLWRRCLRLHCGGVLVGGGLVLASLMPWLASLARGEIAGGDVGFVGRGLLLLYPLQKALVYWVRYASLSISTEMRCFEFVGLFGSAADRPLRAAVEVAGVAVGALTAAISLWANIRLWRGGWRRMTRDQRKSVRPRRWLVGYVRWTFVAMLVVFSLSPTTPMMWQLLIVYHVAILPLVLEVGRLLRTRHRGRVAVAVAAYALLGILLLGLIVVASPHYRCGGRRCGYNTTMPPLRSDHPMLDTLHIRETCPLTVGDPEGWWPDILPEGP